MECLQSNNARSRLFFSIHELLLFARLARVNLVVTTYQQDKFCVAGSTGSVEDTSSVVYVCLSGDSDARVRGHFERMWTKKDVDENRRAWHVECEMRAERENARGAAADRSAKQLAEKRSRENKKDITWKRRIEVLKMRI